MNVMNARSESLRLACSSDLMRGILSFVPALWPPYESGPLQVFAVVRNYTTRRGSVSVEVIKYNQKVLAKERIR